MIAGEWGDSAPAIRKTTVLAALGCTAPVIVGFLDQILKSDEIQTAQKNVVQRNNWGNPYGSDTLDYVIHYYGGPSAFGPGQPCEHLQLEIEVVLLANGPMSVVSVAGPPGEGLNLAQFMAAWNASASDADARNALLAASFPGIDVGMHAYFAAQWQKLQAQLTANTQQQSGSLVNNSGWAPGVLSPAR